MISGLLLIKDKKAEVISAEFKKNEGAGKTIDDIARSMGLTVQEATQINFRSYTVPGCRFRTDTYCCCNCC